MSDELRQSILDAISEREKLLLAAKNDYPDKVEFMANMMAEVIKQGGKILVCGNGGSAAEAQHFVAEMIVRLTEKVERAPMPAMALTTDTSVLTACTNDYGFDRVFSRQVEALGKQGDLLFALSTSGKSENVNKAVEIARELKMETAALIGRGGGDLAEIANYSIVIPSQSTQRIQEEHLFILHQIVEFLQELLSPEI